MHGAKVRLAKNWQPRADRIVGSENFFARIVRENLSLISLSPSVHLPPPPTETATRDDCGKRATYCNANLHSARGHNESNGSKEPAPSIASTNATEHGVPSSY